jgi:hypothetical protein
MSPIKPFALSLTLVASLLACGGCASSESNAEPGNGATAPARTGAIEGRIVHPAHVIPALRICAIGSGQPAARTCVSTQRGQGTYRIAGLAPDDYVVIAVGGDALHRVGGHVRPVQCIRAPCPEMPAAVTVAAGANVTGIDINGFYEKRDDFPAISTD